LDHGGVQRFDGFEPASFDDEWAFTKSEEGLTSVPDGSKSMTCPMPSSRARSAQYLGSAGGLDCGIAGPER